MPRVSLSPQAFGYMTTIGVSAEKGVRSSGRAPRVKRPQALAMPFAKRAVRPRSKRRIQRTVFKMLVIIASILILVTIFNSVHAAERRVGAVSLALEPSSASPWTEPMITHAFDIGQRALTGSDAYANPSSNSSPVPVLALCTGMVLIGFLLISILITLSAFLVGLIDGAWLLQRLGRHRERVQAQVERHSLSEFPSSWKTGGQKSVRPGPTATTCQRWWGLGLASVVGPVRSENQDHAIAWDQGQFRAIVVGDGMGGLPRGKEAATTATRRVARHLAERIADGSILRRPLDIIHECFSAAGGALKITAGITGNTTGLRTTLIVVVLTPQAFFWGYIGDGGLWVYRQDGTINNILTGHKDPDAPNVLFASIGPAVQGYPEIGSTARCPGDVVFVGSDGVFDRIPDPGEFSASVVDAARDHFDGDLQRTVDEVVHQLSEAKDADGNSICDDNLTLVVATPDNDAPLPRASTKREELAHA